MHTCCACLNKFDGEKPPILMMGEYGTPKVLCPDCAALVDAIAGQPDSEERTAAVDKLCTVNVRDPEVAEELARLIHHEEEPAPAEADEAEVDAADMEPEATDEPFDAEIDKEPEIEKTGSFFYLSLALGFLAVALICLFFLR